LGFLKERGDAVMKFRRHLQSLVLSAAASAFLLPAVRAGGAEAPTGKVSSGAIVGVLTNAAKLPVAGATVTATRADGGAIRATVSSSEGIYSFADVTPGEWSISAQVDGYPETVVPAVTVTASKATRNDLVMNATAVAPPALAAGQQPAAPATGGAKPAGGAKAAANDKTPTRSLAETLKLKLAAPESQSIPDALHSPDATEGVDNFTPFAFGDFTWLNGSPRNKQPVFDTKFFTPDIRFDAHYMADFNHPRDHTIVGSTESFRSGEFQLEQVSFGGDFHWENVRARFLSMFGLFATTTPRNDASSAVGQWDLSNAYRYLSEANAGYHFDVGHGLNVDAGIFVSYIGLFSYYNYDNWTYQPSYVSSNTPWFFNGLRIQYFPTNTLKIEPWIINGWQSYARFNGHLGFGGQILWQPNENLKLVFNNYGVGQDNLANQIVTPGVAHPVQPNPLAKAERLHTDDSIELKYYDNKLNGNGLSKAAFSLTLDAGCQSGGGLSCSKGPNKESFLGWMFYNRLWFDHDLYAITIGGGAMYNPGRYLTLLPPINGATAATGTPYFTENPGQPAHMWDATLNFQYMPRQWITWWAEAGFRHSNVPYFAGSGGVTPPTGNNGNPSQFVCNDGAPAGTSLTSGSCSNDGGVWFPDLRTRQTTLSGGILVKF
jgi:hypothetical protein